MNHGDLVEPEPTLSVRTPEQSTAGPGPSRSTSSTQPSEPTGSNIVSADSAGEDEWVLMLEKLKSAIDRYRKEESSKAEAVSCIVQTFWENTDVAITDEQKDMALDSYLAELSSITIHPNSSDL